jgi:hypothetical protein
MNAEPAQKQDNKSNSSLTVSQAAQFLKVSASTLRRLEKEGAIKSTRCDNGYRSFSLEDVQKLKDKLEKNKAKTKSNKTLPSTNYQTNQFIDNKPIFSMPEKSQTNSQTENSQKIGPKTTEQHNNQTVKVIDATSEAHKEHNITPYDYLLDIGMLFHRKTRNNQEDGYMENAGISITDRVRNLSGLKIFALQNAFILLFVFILSSVLTYNPSALFGHSPLFSFKSFTGKDKSTLIAENPNLLGAVLGLREGDPNFIFNINIPSFFREKVVIEDDLDVTGNVAIDGSTGVGTDLTVGGDITGGNNITAINNLISQNDIIAANNAEIGNNLTVRNNLDVSGLASLLGGLLTPSISGVTTIDETTKDTLESTLELSGDATGTLNDVTILSINGASFGNIDPTTGHILMAQGNEWRSVAQTSITRLGIIEVGTWQGDMIGTAYGGTGLSTYTAGDLLFASSPTQLSRLPIGPSDFLLMSDGTAPVWRDPEAYFEGIAWLLTGNDNIDISSHFLGTTTNQPIAFRTNDIERLRITEGGWVGIGLSAPGTGLHLGTGSMSPAYITGETRSAFIEGDLEVGGVIYGHTIGPITTTGFDPYGVFYADQNGTLFNNSSKMTFNPSTDVLWIGGTVGIGVADPSPHALNVGGTVNMTSLYIGGTQVVATPSELNLLSGRSGTLLDSNNVSTYATTGVTAGLGLTGGGTTGVLTLNVGAGPGITVGADSISIDATTTGTTSTTFSNSGLEVTSEGVRLLGGCSHNEVLAWNSGGAWQCESISGIGAVSGGGTAGQLTFWSGSSSISGSNSLTWNNADGFLGVGTATPLYTVDISGNLRTSGNIIFSSLPSGRFVKTGAGGQLTTSTYVSLTSEVTGVLPVAGGGTGGTTLPTAGGVAYGTGTAIDYTTVGLEGQLLVSGGSGAPFWSDGTALGLNYWDKTDNILSPITSDDYITTLGRVGVGNTAPAYTLDVTGDINLTQALRFSGTAGGLNQVPLSDVSGIPTWSNLTTTIVGEGTNLYFTTARARSSVSATAPLQYDVGTGIFSITQASAAADGYLSSTDWSTFNNKLGSALTNGYIFVGNTSDVASAVPVSGDATISSTGELTLATSGVTAGTYGSATQIPTLTIDAKGRITSATNLSILYENPLTVENGLTRISDTISLGGALTADTRLYDTSYEYLYFDTNTGFLGIGTTSPTQKLDVAGAVRLGSAGAYNVLNTTATSEAPTGSLFWGSREICDTSGNCAGTGAGLGGSGTSNYLAKFTAQYSVGDSLIYDSGTALGIGTTSPTSLLTLQSTGAGTLQINPYGTDTGQTGELRFLELAAGGTNYTGFKAPDSLNANLIYTLPPADGDNNYVLATDGTGVLTWKSVEGVGGGVGTITAVGSITSGDAFAGPSASGQWLGLGASAGRITFEDLPTDFISFMDANVGIGTTAPGFTLDVNGNLNTQGFYIGGSQVTAIASELNILSGALISTSEINLLQGRSGTLVDSVNVATYATTGVTAGSGLTGGGTVGVLTLGVGAGSGIAVNADNVAINLSTASTNNLTSSYSGLQVDADGLRLLSGCSVNEVLTWNGTVWSCSTIGGIGAVTGSGAEGQITFWSGTNTLSGSNNFFWDNALARLGIGTTAPGYALDVAGAINLTNALRFGGTAGVLNQVPVSDENGVPTWTSLTTTIVGEGTNLYFTEARARASLSATAPLQYVSNTGVFSITQADTETDGYLSSTDWNTFNNKLSTTLTDGFIFIGDENNIATGVAMSGDATISGSGELSLSATDVTAGTYGSAMQIPVLTIDAKGRITLASNQSISYENPLTFSNGLTRIADTVSLGGALAQDTRLYNASHEFLFFNNSTGMIGIGTTSPTEKLDIEGRIRIAQTSAPATTGDKLYNITGGLFWDGHQICDTSGNCAGSAAGIGGSGVANFMAKFTDQYIIGQSIMYDNGLNIGIGTTAPAYTLDVNGSINLTDTLRFSGTAGGLNQVPVTNALGQPTWSNLTTTIVTEGDNLYFTDARVWAALSASEPLTYDSAGGFAINQASATTDGFLSSTDWSTFNSKESVLTFSNGLTRVANNITLGGLITQDTRLYNASYDFIYFDNGTGMIGIGTTAPTEKLDIAGRMRLAQTSAPVTTTDKMYNVSGGLYWSGYQLCDMSGNCAGSAAGIGGQGTTGHLARFDGEFTLGDSLIYDSGIALGIGTTAPGIGYLVDISGNLNVTGLSLGGVEISASANEINILNGALISTSELNLLQGRSGTLVDSVNVATYATTGVTAGSGLTGGGTVGVLTLGVGAGSGIAVNADNVAINLSTAATTHLTSSYSGLQVDADGLRLLSGCSNNEILAWNGTVWTCSSVSGIGGITGTGTQGQLTFWGADNVLTGSNSLFWDSTLSRLGIGTTAPASAFSIGSSSQFQVDSSGNIIRINNVPYSWPSAAGTPNQVLTYTDGGVLTWGAVLASDVAANTLDFEHFKDDMTLDATTTVNFYNTDETSSFDYRFFNSHLALELMFFSGSDGFIGIGTTAPTEKLDIDGRVRLAQTSAPVATTDKLYNVGGGLHWSGYEVCDASGNCAGTGAGIGGSGTENYLTKFTGQYEIGNSIVYDSGTNLGIGTTSPAYTLDVAGGINLTGALRFTGSAGALNQVPVSDASGIPTWTSLTTTIVGEGTNLYFTDARARAALSASAPLQYNSGTGVFTITQSGTGADGYLSSTDWNTFNNKLSGTLTSGNIFVGNESNLATGVAMSGDATISNTGALTLANTTVTAGQYGSATEIPILTIDSKGRITLASTATITYESPLTFSNGLTRSTNTITLGGLLSQDTRLYNASHEFLFFDNATGMIGIGTTSPTEKLDLEGRVRLAQTSAPGTTTDKLYNVGGGLFWDGNQVCDTSGNCAGTGAGIGGGGTTNYISKFTGEYSLGDSLIYDSGTALGIGTTSPTSLLTLAPTTAAGIQLNPFGTLAGNTSELRFLELAAGGTNYTGFKAPDSLDVNLIYTLPSEDGSEDYVLTTSGSGVLTWKSITGAGGGTGTITAVGSITSGAAFAGSASSGHWLGLGATAGRIAFQSGTTDFINLLGANIGIGTTSPISLLSVGPASEFQVSSAGAITAATGIASSGNIDFVSLNTGGLVKAADTTGRLSIATAGVDYQAPLTAGTHYEVPLTFSNGLTRSTNAITLGGLLTQDTRLYNASFEYLFFDNITGMIGIGTTAPSEKLDIDGRVRLAQTSAPVATTDKLYNVGGGLHWSGYQLCDASGNCAGTGAGIGGSGTENYLTKFTGQYEIGNSLIFDTGTALGIGTTAPKALLHIHESALGANRFALRVTEPYNHDSNDWTGIGIGVDSVLKTGIIFQQHTNYSRGKLHLAVNSVADNSEVSLSDARLTIDGSFVGIGNVNPKARLESLSTTAEQLRLTYTDNTHFTTFTTDSTGNMFIEPSGGIVTATGKANALAFRATGPYNPSSGEWTGIGIGTVTPKTGILFEQTTNWSRGKLHLAVNNAENSGLVSLSDVVMTLDLNKNVGIGTTAPGYKLDVVGDIRIAAGSDLYLEGEALRGTVLGNRTYTGQHYIVNAQSFTTSINALDIGLNNLETGTTGLWRNETGYIRASNVGDIAGTLFRVYDTGGVSIGRAADPGAGSLYVYDTLTIGSSSLTLQNGLIASSIGLSIQLGDAAGAHSLNIRDSDEVNLFTLDSTGNLALTDGTASFSYGTGALDAFTITNAGTGLSFRVNDQSGDTTPFVIDAEGRVGVGTTAPSSALSIGATSQFQVNSTGNLIRINNVAYSWPELAGTANQVLTFNEGGTLTWGAVLASDVAANTLDFEHFKDAMTLDATTTVNFYNAGETSSFDYRFFNSNTSTEIAFFSGSTGRAGIGTTAPNHTLDVAGNIGLGAGSYLNWGATTGTGGYGIRDNSGTLEFKNNEGEWSELGSGGGAASLQEAYEGGNTIELSSTFGDLHIFNDSGDEILFLDEATGRVGIGTTAPTFKLDVVSEDTTGVLNLTANSVTSGTAASLAVNGLTSGTGLALTSTSNALTTGSLLSLDWSPTLATVATGDLFKINIGSNATLNGNLFALYNNNSAVFTVSPNQITSAAPHQFTAAGDVSIAYDLMFTNQSASYIKSKAPFYIEAGEIYESSDLTLRTFNAGDIILNPGGSTFIHNLNPTMVFSTSTAGDTNYWMGIINDEGNNDNDIFVIGKGIVNGLNNYLSLNASGYLGIGTTAPTQLLDVAGSIRLGAAGANNVLGTSIGSDPTGSLYWGSRLVCDSSGNCAGTGAGLAGEGTTNFLAKFTGQYEVGSSIMYDSGTYIGIGTTAPAYTLDVNGNINTSELYISGEQITASALDINILDGALISTIELNYLAGSSVLEGGLIFGDGTNFTQDAANLFWDSTNKRLGIGTTNPQASLDIAGSTSVISNSAGELTISSVSDIILSPTGNVGIGTTDPQAKLSVGDLSQFQVSYTGAIAAATGISSSGNIDFSSLAAGGIVTADPTTGRLSVATSGTDYEVPLTFSNGLTRDTNAVSLGGEVTGDIRLFDSSNEFLFIDSSTGNLGIGTTAPNHKLEVAGNIGMTAGSYLNWGATSGETGYGIRDNAGVIEFKNTDGTWAAMGSGGGAGNLQGAYEGGNTIEMTGAYGSVHIFNDSGDEVLYLDQATGRVGIGTTAPSTKLQVASIGSENTLLSLDWSPDTPISASGDLFSINIGSNATLNGNLLGIYNNNTDVFVVSPAQIVSAVPHHFAAVGDVSIAHDLVFTNQTAAYIKSYGPLYIESGEVFENNDLTLRTFGAGNVFMDLSGTGNLALRGASPTIVFDTRTANDTDFWAGTVSNADLTNNDYFSIGTGTIPGTNPHFTVTHAGNVGVGTVNPSTMFSVGSTSQFRVDSSGDIARIRNLAYAWPTAHTASGVLINNGSGTLSWGTIGAASVTANSLDFAQFSDSMTIDANTTINMYGGGTARTLRFYNSNNSVEAFFINGATGRIGIGTVSPNADLSFGGNSARVIQMERHGTAGAAGNDLHVRAGGAAANMSDGTGGNLYLTSGISTGGAGSNIYLSTANASGLSGMGDVNPTIKMTITDSGNVGIGLTNPTYQLQLSEDSAAKPTSNTWTISSDERLKKDITVFADGLEVIRGIKPVHYKLNGLAGLPMDAEGIGVLAQDIVNVAPYTVKTYEAYLNPGDTQKTTLFSFDSSALTFVAINAIKELDMRVSTLSTQLDVDFGDDMNNYDSMISSLDTQVKGINTELSQVRNEMALLNELIEELSSEVAGVNQTTESFETPTDILAAMITLFEDFKSFVSALGLKATEEDGLLVSSDMNVLGDATLGGLTVTGDINAGLIRIDTLDNSIGINGPSCYTEIIDHKNEALCLAQTLYLQKELAGNIDIFDGRVLIEPDGKLSVSGEIKAEKYSVETEIEDASAGKVTILAGQTRIEVSTLALTPESIIIVTPDRAVPVGARVVEIDTGQVLGSQIQGDDLNPEDGLNLEDEERIFEITLSYPLHVDVNVSWWIIN